MFYITIDGQIRNKKQVYNFTELVLQHFFKYRVKRPVDINMKIVKHLPDNDMGLCDGDRDEVNIDIAKGYLDENDQYQLYDYDLVIRTVAHELIHAKQFIRGQMSSTSDNWIEKGVKKDCRRLPYKKLPWEKEAYGLEDELFETYWNSKV